MGLLHLEDGLRTRAIGKELPMDLTATVTAIMAIMSFSFLAAVILGMI